MNDEAKTQEQLIQELQELRQQVAKLESLEKERKQREEELEKQILAQRLIDNIVNPIFYADTQSVYVGCNAAFEAYLGLSRENIIGKSLYDLVPHDLADQYYAMDQDLICHPGTQAYEATIQYADGSQHDVLFNKATYSNADGSVGGIVGVMVDITERKQAEAERKRLLADVQRRALQLQTAARVSHAASSILNLDELLPQAVELIRDHFNLYYVGLFLVDETGRYAVLRAGTGEAGRKMLEAGHKLATGGTSMIGSCVTNGQARIALDVGEEAVRFDNPLLPQTRSEIALPLISRGQVIGAMTIQSDRPAAFTAEDITALQTMADQLANAIENARLLDETKSRLAQLTALQETTKAVVSTLELGKLLHLITQQATSLLQSQGGIINLVDWEKREDEVVASSGSAAHALGERAALESNLSGWVTLHNQPVISNQLQLDSRANVGGSSWQSTAIAPLTVKDRVVGTLVVLDKQGGKREFDQADLDLLIALANQAAIAIQNARLFEETQAALVEAKTLAEALRVSEERFALATKGANDGLWDWDIQGKSLYWSPRLKELIGYADDELQIDFETFNSLMHPDDRAPTGAAIDAHLKDRVPYDVEERLLAKSGEYRWFRARGQAVWDEAGNPVRMVGFTSDITERKQAEAERERLLAEQARRALQLQTAAEVSRAASSILSLDELLPQVVGLVRNRFNLYYVGLFLVDETGQYAVLRAGTGEAGRKMLEAGHKLATGGTSMIGSCVTNGQARIALDVGEEAVRFSNPFLPETRSELALPLISRGQAIGAMTVQSTQEAAFSEADVTVLQTMADQVANAIANARLFEETRRRAEEMAALNDLSRALSSRLDASQVMDEVYRGVSRLLDTTNFYIALYDPIQHQVSFPINVTESVADKEITLLSADQGITGYILRTRESVLIHEDVNRWLEQSGMEHVGEPAQSWLGVPMMLGDQTLGVIAIQDYRTPNAYSERDRDVLAAIAAQTAIAIQNARLFEEAHTRAEELAVLNEMSRAASATLDLNATIQLIYDSTCRLMDATNFYVALYDPQLDEVSFPFYAEGDRIRALQGRRRTGQGLTEYVIRTCEPLLIEENVTARLQELGIEAVGQDSRSWLGVPISVGDQVLGVIAVQSYTTPRVYNQHHRDLLLAIAGQSAIAIQNARLFEQTQAARAQAESRLSEVQILQYLTQQVSGTLDLERVLDALVNTLAEQMHFGFIQFSLIDEPANAVRTLRATGLARGMNGRVRPLDKMQNDIVMDVARKGQIEVIDGWDDRFDREIFEREGHAALVRAFVPLRLREQTLGILEAGYRRMERSAITPEEVRLLGSLADQVAVAIQNTRLYEQTQARARREQLLREVTARVRSSTDPDTVMRTLARELGTVLGRPTFVRLVSPEGGNPERGNTEQLSQAFATQAISGNGNQPASEGGR